MTLVAFWLYTIVVGTAFTYALLWVIAQWLKSTEEAEKVDAQLGEVVRREERKAA